MVLIGMHQNGDFGLKVGHRKIVKMGQLRSAVALPRKVLNNIPNYATTLGKQVEVI